MTYWKESNACIKHRTDLNTGVTINTYLMSNGQYSGHILSCWKSVERYPKTELWLRHPDISGYLFFIYEDNQWYFWLCIFHFCCGGNLALLSWRVVVMHLEWVVRCTALWLQNSLLYYVLLYCLPAPIHEYVDRGQPDCEQWCWESISTFHSSSRILMWLHFSKRFLFSF